MFDDFQKGNVINYKVDNQLKLCMVIAVVLPALKAGWLVDWQTK